MPLERDSDPRNNPSPQTEGNPSDTGQDKAATKKAGSEAEQARAEEIREKYMDDQGNLAPDLKKHSNPNRNTDKPDLDKPAYN